MKAMPTRVSFLIELTQAQWDKLDSLDYDVINDAITEAGAVRNTLNYDGHFGMNVFFDMDVDDKDLMSVSEIEKAFEQLLGAS